MPMLRILQIVLILLYSTYSVTAQENLATVQGHFINAKDSSGIECQILHKSQKQLFQTNEEGYFSIPLNYGTVKLFVQIQNEIIDSFEIVIDQAQIDLGQIVLQYDLNSTQSQNDIPNINLETLNDAYEEDGDSKSQNISMLLNTMGARDPFLNACAFSFSPYYFKPRGNYGKEQSLLFNGVSLNDIYNGGINSTQWAGLNEWFKSPISSYGLSQHEMSLGGLNGVQSFNFNPLDLSKGTKLSYSLSNRQYNNRVLASYNSGKSTKAWAYSIIGSRRWAQEAYIPGTHYDAYALAFSLAKELNSKQKISVSVLGTHIQRSAYAAVTKELFELTQDSYYNPSWGWQNDKKRNANEQNSTQPLCVIQHIYEPNTKTKLYSCASIAWGQKNQSTLDWYNALDPRADYYQKLPSYYDKSNPLIANNLKEAIMANPKLLQLDWNRMYEANQMNQESLNNAQGTINGNRALYVQAADVQQYKNASFNSIWLKQTSANSSISAGIQLQMQQTKFYRTLIDLLGADYFLNYNMFAAQQFQTQNSLKQFDLQNPDRAIKVGDTYRYDYSIFQQQHKAWAQYQLEGARFLTFIGAALNYHQYQKKSNYQNGLFPQNSLGKSNAFNFLLYQLKAGLQYKINGRNYLVLHAMSKSDDIGAANIWISPRTRHQSLNTNMITLYHSLETGYKLQAPKTKISIMGYLIETKNATLIQRYFNDDPAILTYVNFVQQNMNTRQIGLELGAEYALNSSWTWSMAAAIGQYFYTNNPKVSIYSDMDTAQNVQSKNVYIKNYYLGLGPQSAYTSGIRYNAKKFWYINFHANYFDRNYIAINPNRRSQEAAELIDPNSSTYKQIFQQEKLPSFYSFDIGLGKSILLKKWFPNMDRKNRLYINLSINNLLNNRAILLSGREQLRYDFTNNDPTKFPTKYQYARGVNFFFNISLKF